MVVWATMGREVTVEFNLVDEISWVVMLDGVISFVSGCQNGSSLSLVDVVLAWCDGVCYGVVALCEASM